MPSKLSRYCEGVMEAIWLTALIVVPVFFNIYSSRIFEPDKLALLRSLALVALGAWVIKLVDQGKVLWEVERGDNEPWHQTILKIPLMRQVGLLVGVILVASVFSITPRISFLGSYQRLQGTYTTLAYLTIFATIVGNMRRREQVNRLILTVILASLPIGLYGILQRFQIDPVPWGGDVSRRIAANLGNSIFVAAYLILAFPLTLGKIVEAFTAILKDDDGVAANVARGTIFVFTAAIQLIAIYLAGSRGPFLGWLAGSLMMFLLLSLYWNKRWLTLSLMGVGGAVLVFLIVFSLPNGPLASLQGRSGLGRLGNVFDVDSGTGRVRALIWEGASRLIAPHAALEFPDGHKDPFNFARPLIGYGPESMYVAYNPFYPPELGNIESRNASPDRSHNETWDALVTTGGLGFIAYLAFFTSIFYYGLHWLGMINSPRQRNLFLGLVLGGGVASAAGFIAWGGIGFLGVGFPYGMLAGLGIYLALVSIFSRYEAPKTEGSRLRALTLMMFLTAIIAHFGEIHLGIAIAATRTHFWAYAGVLLAVGYLMTQRGVYGDDLRTEEAGPETPEEVEESVKARKNKKNKATRSLRTKSSQPDWQRFSVISGMITGIVLSTLGYDFITNSKRSLSGLEILWTSLTTLPNQEYKVSYGILVMLITLWLAASVLFTAENKGVNRGNWLKALTLSLGVSGAMGVFFWFIHAGGLAGVVRTAAIAQQAAMEAGEGNVVTLDSILAQASKLEGLLTTYYFFLIMLVLGLGWFVVADWTPRNGTNNSLSWVAVPVLSLLIIFTMGATNLRIIHADIAFKLADPFARGEDPTQWQYAIALYKRANAYAPSEDHYYLFLGRAYLESARLLQTQNPAETQRLMTEAKSDLLEAQSINPLNTDHTANLARLHRFWASIVSEANQRTELAEEAGRNYARAVVLSPNNVVIWNEWAALYLSLLQNPGRAIELLEYSLEVDPDYFGTYGILGQYYAQNARQATDETTQAAAYAQAVAYYQDAIAHITRERDANSKYSFLAELANLQTEFKHYQDAILTYQEALPVANRQAWRVEEAMARVYLQMGEPNAALQAASSALISAPENQKPRIQELIAQIQQNTP